MITHQMRATVWKSPHLVKTKCGLVGSRKALRISIWGSDVNCPQCLHPGNPELNDLVDGIEFGFSTAP
jgi:hypothetical protein